MPDVVSDQFSTEDLVDFLISNWNDWEHEEGYYLSTLVPAMISDLDSAGLTWDEYAVAERLRDHLGPEGWAGLADLVRARVAVWRSACSTDRVKRSLEDWVKLERLRSRERELAQAEEEARTRKELEKQSREARAEALRQEQQREREEAERERQRLAEIESRRVALCEQLRAELRMDFLAVRHPKSEVEGELVGAVEFRALRREVASEWAASRQLQQDWRLDEEQLEAVAATDGDIRVTARAGSGKTRTLVMRALFLQTHCKVDPSEILLLAFNRNAAQEMEERIGKVAKERLPHVMTFHALAHALVHPDEELVADDESAGRFGLSRELQEVIDEHIRSAASGAQVRELMLSHFRDDWERIVGGGHNLTMSEFLEARRAHPSETLQGEFVKSYGEKLLANTLFEHSVPYEYERNFRWDGANYRPDFTLVGNKVVIEYFGLRGDPDYDERSQEKREFWRRKGDWQLLEFTPADIAQPRPSGFQERLLGELRGLGIPIRVRSEEEIWELVRARAIDGFTKAMRTFVGRCRKRNLDDEGVQLLLDAKPPGSRAEELFGSLGRSIYRGYLHQLKTRGKEDFDGLMWRAVEAVRQGHTRFRRRGGREVGDLRRIRFVHIDEFQDFSQMFYELVAAARNWNPGMGLFCVGDDWQAINGFAGSELRFVTEFDALFRQTSTLEIATNYRSCRQVIAAGNALMRGRGREARSGRGNEVPGRVLVGRMEAFEPTGAEQERYEGDEITPALLRLLQRFLRSHRRIVILARRKAVPWYVVFPSGSKGDDDGLDRFLRHLRRQLPDEDRERVIASTVHSFKGREEDAVVVVDAVQRCFPLIHPNWVFFRVFGDDPESLLEEERRLFYVAITRARSSLALLTDGLAKSPFLLDLEASPEVEELEWRELPPLAVEAEDLVETRVLKSFEIRDQLKDRGFRFRPQKFGGPFWWRMVPRSDFNPEALLRESWVCPGLRIEVLSERQERIFERTI